MKKDGKLASTARAIDRLSRAIGTFVGWLTLAMVLVGAFNAVARYSGRWLGANLASNAWLELQWYLFSAVFLLGAAYTLQQNAHVRVDVVYGRLPPKARHWIDLLGALLFLLPFTIFALWLSWPPVKSSWAIREMSSDPGGLPRYPIKALILVAFALLFLQGVAEAIKAALRLRSGEGAPSDPHGGTHGGGA